MKGSKTEKNGYHLVDGSPWPVVTASGVMGLGTGGVSYMHGYGKGGWLILVGLLVIGQGMRNWLRDVIREGTLEGQHTTRVQRSLRGGMILFILSEVMLFFALFWGYFWSSISPVIEIGSVWPPKGIEVMEAWKVPFLNTLILLTSGGSITWAHHGMLIGSRREALKGLIITVILAIIFTGLQGYEYKNAGFNIGDGIYGATFYLTTGMHGFHVIVGTIMISVCIIRIINYEMTREHHFGFEGSAWYWHFVDVVWLGLFISIYWWGS